MKHKTRGSTLLAVLFIVVIVSALIGAVFSVTSNYARNSSHNVERSKAIAYADGVIEHFYEQWRWAMINVTASADRQNGLSASALSTINIAPTSAQWPLPPGAILVSASVVPATPMLDPLATGTPTRESGTNSQWNYRLYYLATATVQYSGQTGNSTVGQSGSRTVTVQRAFVRGGQNIFDNFYFGTQPVTEINPGPDMYIGGKVYVGGDLYTAHNSLHFGTDVNFLGKHVKNYRPEDNGSGRYGSYADIASDPNGTTHTVAGTENYTDNWDPLNPPRKTSNEQKLLDLKSSSLEAIFLDDPNSNDASADGNANNDGYHEIIEEAVTTDADPLKLDSVTSERMVESADYRISVDAANVLTIVAANPTGSALPTRVLTTGAEYTAIVGAITKNTIIKDAREGDFVRVLTLDVNLIRQAQVAGTLVDNVGGGDGFTFYIQDKSFGSPVTGIPFNASTVTSSRTRGIKLVNGGQLPATGLTIVSPNPVYIQGDYNTGASGTSRPLSDTTTTYTSGVDTPSPVVGTYQRAPAAVIADAVNILSNAWSDANSNSALTSRIASNTTINAAILAGNVPSILGGSYSGGVENFPRFHEDWTNRYFTIYGAIASLYNSRQAKGSWSGASYGAPLRRWFYDTKLQDNNPPGFHASRTYERGRWTSR